LKNQYFGDENDYLKYGLLRCFSYAGWRVGVCWMLTPDDGGRQGRKIDYLSKASLWRRHDPFLFDALSSATRPGLPRRVAVVEEGSLIPNAHFFSRTVPRNKPRRSAENKFRRSAWFESGLDALSSCDLLFFDPDNGLEVRSKPASTKGSEKYLYWGEVRLAWERGFSLLIFQHFTHENRRAFIDRLSRKLEREATDAVVTPVRTANVLFLLACQPKHVPMAKAALELTTSKWQERLQETPEE
jgi:hypothetical protein